MQEHPWQSKLLWILTVLCTPHFGETFLCVGITCPPGKYNGLSCRRNSPVDWPRHLYAALWAEKKPRRLARLFCVLALPIFPAGHPASIVGADELNFCVRDGNRWTLIAINTNFFGWAFTHLLCQSLSALTAWIL